MSQKKPTLGRGLDALLGHTSKRPATPVPIHGPISGGTNGTSAPVSGGTVATGEAGATTPGPAGTGGTHSATAADTHIPLSSGEVLARLPLDLLQRGKY